ncbi:MAG: WecB/TagA/CpsF family glycosyltransferase [bacterium]|nr:WecB/TagA/CpsF family glycosyltransferase [bacterium]
MNTISLFGYNINQCSYYDILKSLPSLSSNKMFNIIITLNPQIIVKAEKSDSMRSFIKRAAFCVPDGTALIISALLIKRKKINRITGIDLVSKLLSTNNSFYLAGGREEVIIRAVENISKAYPGVCIKGYHHGFFSDRQEQAVIEDIKIKKPDIILVGMGYPEQELFLEKLSGQLNSGTGIGVGGSFDVLSGSKKRAPRLIQYLGLEWFFRGLIEPARMAGWWFIPVFFWLLLKEAVFDRRKLT